MPNKIALFLTIILVIVDVNLLFDFVNQPKASSPQGGLGNGLIELYALLVIAGIIFYQLIFLILYFIKKFTAAKVMCWTLLALNVFFGGWILLAFH